MEKEIKIMLADDHPLILQGTKDILESNGYHVSKMCSNGQEALLYMEKYSPDIAILDVSMPLISGIEVAKTVQANKLMSKVVLLTVHNENNVFKKAVEYGVYGYLLKNFSTDELLTCMEKVSRDEKYFSTHLEDELLVGKKESAIEKLNVTEKKILELIAQNKNNKLIGETLFLSERTIEWHRRNIIEKLDLPKEKNSLLTWALLNIKSD